MRKQLTSLIVLTLASTLLHALPTMADTKPVSSNNMSEPSSSEAAHGDPPSVDVTVTKGGKFQVSVQVDPEKPAPNKPVNIMVTVKNEADGEPVLDASVSVDMMLMDSGTHSNMSEMSMLRHYSSRTS